MQPCRRPVRKYNFFNLQIERVLKATDSVNKFRDDDVRILLKGFRGGGGMPSKICQRFMRGEKGERCDRSKNGSSLYDAHVNTISPTKESPKSQNTGNRIPPPPNRARYLTNYSLEGENSRRDRVSFFANKGSRYENTLKCCSRIIFFERFRNGEENNL